MKAFSVLFVFSIILSLTSCNDNTQSVENGKINGQVLSYKTMKPIAGAYISTQPSTSNVMTDASGNFVLTDVVPNSYLLFANKFGYYQNYSSITIQSGKTVNAIILLKDSVVNNNPEKPLLLSPKDKATISSSEILLEWSCADPDNDYLTYDVIIDTNFLSGKIIFSNINQTKVVINNLISGKTYYWKIIAKDTLGAITESNIYSFNVTINHNPLKPVILSPDEGTIINGNEVQLEWSCTDPDNDNLTYDILMDTIVVVGKLIYQNITPNKVVVKNLISGKTYYWKIIAKDKSDLSSESNIYSFIVIINHNPNEPVLLSPVDGAIISKTYSQLNWSCYDPDNDNLTFDVYLDTNIFVEKIINTNITQTRITVNNLISGKTYYWKIIAKDNSGASSESDIYSFICDTTNNIPEDNSFVCYFPFNNDVDNYIKNYLTVSYYDITFIEDKDFKSNSAAYFSGVSHITVQNNPIFQNWNELTISVWLKPDVGYGNPYPPTGYIFIIGRWLASGSNTSTWGLVFLQPSKLLQGVTHDGITTSKCSTDKLNERVWTHVAFTYKSGISKIYINGIEENSINAASLQNSPYNLEIGWHKDNICQYKGGMDDLKIFKRALSDNEILQLSK